MTSSIQTQEPAKWAGQPNYEAVNNKIVRDLATSFHRAVAEKQDLQVLFHETLKNLGALLHHFAQEEEFTNATSFGMRRDSPEHFLGINGMMHFSTTHPSSHTRLLSVLQKHLQSMPDLPKILTQNDMNSVIKAETLGIESAISITVFPREKIRAWAFYPTPETLTKLSSICNYASSDPNKNLSYQFSALLKNSKAMAILKERSPQDFNSIRLSTCMAHMRHEWMDTDWALMTYQLKIGDAVYPLSEYLTWVNDDYIKTPLETMAGTPTIGLLHQDVFLLEGMLSGIAIVFKNALTCSNENITQLKNTCALFHYELAHAMPFISGSEAVIRLLEKAIFQFHGYSLTYNPTKDMNLEALISRPTEFVTNYDLMVQFGKIEQNSKEERETQ